jgi:hypothetical protein
VTRAATIDHESASAEDGVPFGSTSAVDDGLPKGESSSKENASNDMFVSKK